MPNVFLSYKREDLKAATRLVEALRAAGFDVWWDRDIPATAPWEATIERTLADAEVVLVCWSTAAVASENVRSEARWARGRGRLVQVFVEPCEPPLFFGERQGIDLSGWSGDPADERFGTLAAAIRERLGHLESLVDASAPIPKRPRRTKRAARSVWTAAAAAVVALAGLGVWLAWDRLPWSAPAPTRIAILPFDTADGGQAEHAFADDLTDQLQSVLTSNRRETVSGTAASTLAGPEQDRAIRALGVRLLFSGRVQRQGDSLSARVRLDDAPHHVTLWTLDMQGPATDPEALAAQVGARTIAVLNCSARALRPKGGLSDLDALGLLLKGCDTFEEQGFGDDPQAVLALLDTFREVVAKAPDFAPGHAELAKFLAYYRNYLPADQAPQLAAEAMREAKKAMAIDPKDPDAICALFLLTPPRDFIAQDRIINQDLPFDPSWVYVDIFRGAFLMEVGRLREGLIFAQRAVAANPLSLDTTADIPLALAGQFRAANEELARLLRLWPDGPLLWNDRMVVYTSEDNWSALEATLDNPAIRPKTTSDAQIALLRVIYKGVRTKSPADVEAARRAILSPSGAGSLPLNIRVDCLAWLGLLDDAFALANSQLVSSADDLTFLFDNHTAAMRHDRRFMPLAAKLGLVDYWRATGKWPDFCSEPGLPYDCKAEAAKLAAPSRKT